MLQRWSASLALLALATTGLAAEIAVRKVDEDNFIFRLRTETLLSEAEAQAVVARAAPSVCGERVPKPGEYRLQSQQPLDGGAATPAAAFEFFQDVACVAAAGPVAADAAPAVFSKEEKDKAAADALDRTEQYFRLLGEGKVDEAWKSLNLVSGTWDEASWKQSKHEFQAMAGALHRIEITRVTLYENPKSAAEPGLYAAADYRNIWLNVPMQCGYLVWIRTASGELLITREETGHVTSAQLQAMTAQQQQAVPQALRCR